MINKLMAIGCVLTLSAAPLMAGEMSKAADAKDPAMRAVVSQFEKLDTDGDQRVSKQELTEQAIELADFEQADANSDGVLDQEEFAAAIRE